MDYYYDYSASTTNMDPASLTIYYIIVSIVAILLIVAQWKIFTKAGEKGWKSIIPIYNLVTLFKIIGLSPWLILVYLLTAIPFVGWIIAIVMEVITAIYLGKSFGKETGFIVGLALLPNIFELILGFGSAEYVGPYKKENA